MAGDAVQVAPHVYKSVLDNDQVRVLDVRMKPGDTTEMHHHPPVVAYAIKGGKFKFTSLGGESMEVELNDGDSLYLDAVDHSTENLGTTDAHVILVELK